jgi:hypothetical protein
VRECHQKGSDGKSGLRKVGVGSRLTPYVVVVHHERGARLNVAAIRTNEIDWIDRRLVCNFDVFARSA